MTKKIELTKFQQGVIMGSISKIKKDKLHPSCKKEFEKLLQDFKKAKKVVLVLK